MVKIIPATEWEGLKALPCHERLPAFDAALCQAHHCEVHLVTLREGFVVARSSLWWKHSPTLEGQRLGVIGHFAALDRAAAVELLEAARLELAKHGCTSMVGPMDGNTWHRYRFITERGSEPAFFLEPDNPDEWPQWFRDAGFSPLATYFSAINTDLSVEDPRIPRTWERLQRGGITLRSLDPAQFHEELRRIYAVCCVSFSANYLYTPISEAEFLAQYEPIRAQIRPELVLVAEQAGQTAGAEGPAGMPGLPDARKMPAVPVGFVFTLPDLAQARRGSIDTAVLKTVAVLPGRAYAGLGNVLVARSQEAARSLGFRRVIHALMHETNNSLNLSAHYARPFRRYTLYCRPVP